MEPSERPSVESQATKEKDTFPLKSFIGTNRIRLVSPFTRRTTACVKLVPDGTRCHLICNGSDIKPLPEALPDPLMSSPDPLPDPLIYDMMVSRIPPDPLDTS